MLFKKKNEVNVLYLYFNLQALCVYWVASSSYGLAQNLILFSPSLRRAVGIPLTKSELARPYEHLWNSILIKTGQKMPEIPVSIESQKGVASEKKTITTKEKSAKS